MTLSARTSSTGRLVQRPKVTIGVWAALLAISWLGAIEWGEPTSNAIVVPNSDSRDANEAAAKSPLGHLVGLHSTIVFTVEDGTIDEPERSAAIAAVLETLSDGLAYIDPDRPFVSGQVGSNRRQAFAKVWYPLDQDPGIDELEFIRSTTDGLAAFGIESFVGGTLAEASEDPAPALLEYIGLLVALLILWRALGTIRLALLPILAALAGVGVAVPFAMVLSSFIVVPDPAIQLASLIGLAIGIDYGLLWIASQSGPNDDKNMEAGESTTQVVSLAAATVALSIVGLFVLGIGYFSAIAIASLCSIALVLGATLTLLPALATISGSVEAPWFSQPSERHEILLSRVVRHPLVAAVVALFGFALLIAPAPFLDLGPSGAATADTNSQRRQVFDLLSDDFGAGYPSPFTVVVSFERSDPSEAGSIAELVREAAEGTDGIVALDEPSWGFGGGEVGFDAFASTGSDDPTTEETLRSLRAAVAAAVGEGGAKAMVGGDLATRIDVNQRVQNRLAPMLGLVVLLIAGALLWRWRAPGLAIKAVVINSFSVLSSYGVLVAVFQWGWGASLIGLSSTVPIDPLVPVFLFAILFGLSMDYEVFLLSAVRQRFAAGETDARAIIAGLSSRRRLVLVAACVMAAVFAGFIIASDPITKMFGVGLTSAVIVDATLSRALLVPAVLTLMGRANHWVPRWLAPKAR